MSTNTKLNFICSSAFCILSSVVFFYFEQWFVFKCLVYFLTTSALLIQLYVYYDEYKTSIVLRQLEEWADKNKLVFEKSSVEAKPFKLEYDEKEWQYLLKKLEMSRYFEPLDEKYVKRNEYGFDSDYARDLINYWKKEFNWKKQIDDLNRYPQFKIQIDQICIHYVHFITNKNNNNVSKRIPVMLLDGWPGSFFGFYKMIDHMKDKFDEVSFDIIVPSIPGFGFSTPLTKPIDYIDTAMLFDALMRFVHSEDVEYFIHGIC
jgi:hypothetical protein